MKKICILLLLCLGCLNLSGCGISSDSITERSEAVNGICPLTTHH